MDIGRGGRAGLVFLPTESFQFVNEDVKKMIATAATNPVGAALLTAIAQATTAEALHRIAEHDILEAKEISEKQRRGLQEAVKQQFSALNAAALRGAGKPRWHHFAPPPLPNNLNPPQDRPDCR
jgi:hypothetical protein